MNITSKNTVHPAPTISFVGEPPSWVFVVLLSLIWAYLLAAAVGLATWVGAINLIGPLTLGVSAAITGYRLTRRWSEAIWTAYAWFLLAIVLFYAIGPLIYSLAGPSTRAYALSFLPINAGQLLRTNLLDTVGILAVLTGFRLAHGWGATSTKETRKVMQFGNIVRARIVALVFLVIGGGMEYLLILPSMFGLYHFVLPGVIGNLMGNLYLLGLMVLAYVVARGDRAWRLPLALLWAVQVVVSLLTFSKHQLIFSIALPALGAYLGHQRKSRLLAWGVILGLAYFSVGQLIGYGRNTIFVRTGNIGQASLTQRASIVERWYAQGMPSVNARVSAAGTGWGRLNYAPEQAFAMTRYDQGYPGHTLRNIGIVLIPRLVWPGKPITTNIGVNFYQLVTGLRGSHLGLGIFGEGYWDYGWVGVVGLGLATGLIFAVLSNLVIDWMRRRAFEYLPSIFLGITMGAVGTTQSFINSVIGGSGLFFAYALLAWFVVHLFVKEPSPVSATHWAGRS
jgi:hypothetical protein